MLFLCYHEDKVVAFGAAMPFLKSSIANQIDHQELENLGLDINSTWYMADLGVSPEMRRLGLGLQLVLARLKAFPKGSDVVMRTHQNNTSSQKLYETLGFRLLSITQDVDQERQDGAIRSDKRILMHKMI